MKLETKKLLFDVMSACQSIARFTADWTFEGYTENEILKSAVERKFEIVGEALVRLRAVDLAVFERIHGAQPVIGFRNRLVHGYDAVDHRIVWDIIQNELPSLQAQVERLLGEEG